jgi:hypothetical protein
VITPDYRDSTEALVHKDLRLSFDGNRYCVPPRYVGRHLTIKAEASTVTIYDQYQEIVSYARCWQRGQTLGAQRFQKELLAPVRGRGKWYNVTGDDVQPIVSKGCWTTRGCANQQGAHNITVHSGGHCGKIAMSECAGGVGL